MRRLRAVIGFWVKLGPWRSAALTSHTSLAVEIRFQFNVCPGKLFFSVNFYEVAILFEMKILHLLLLSLLLSFRLTDAIEPISTSIAVGMAAALTGFLASYQNIFYYFHECCRPEWIYFNRTGKQQTSLAVIMFFIYH